MTEAFLAKIAGWEAMKQARGLLEARHVLSSNWTPPILKGVVQEGSISYRAGLVIKDTIDIEIQVDAHLFQVVLRDSGLCFDPKQIPEPDLQYQVATGQRHGLGIFLMRRFMDEVEYLFKEGVRNELRMTKHLDSGD